MFWGKRKRSDESRGFLMTLLRDVRGNALIIMTAALIPLAGMVGGGIDVSRMYILKTRLQHACDAGTLAGRKAMGGGTWSFNNNYPRTQANLFFDGNFETGSFGSSGLTRTFTENAGKVTGTVAATIPMTLMRIFGRTTETIEVTCSAEMRLPNTDVMFVLDTTGSMTALQPGDSVSKMDALKTSVKCFYEIVARLDTNANCTTGIPSGGTGQQVQIRFGFMPYSTNVNVGKLLPTSYFADSWKYQSRLPNWNNATSSSWTQTSSSVQAINNISVPNVAYAQCNDQAAQNAGYNPQTGYTNTTATTRWYDKTLTRVTGWAAYGNGYGTCSATQTRTRYFETLQTTTTKTFRDWHYNQHDVNVGLLKDGANWRTSFVWPIGASGTDRTITWDGCIEERTTVQSVTDFEPIPSGAKDLDIDLVPNAGTPGSLWAPALQQVIFARAVTTDWSQMNAAAVPNTAADYFNNVPYFCPTEARKLQEWPAASAFDGYVDSLTPTGNTYHDIGLIWGARFASPSGIFAAENRSTVSGGEIERHIIFMTDGDAVSQPCDYTAYGFLFLDKRTTTDVGPAASCVSYPGGRPALNEQINKRTEGLCAEIKNKTFEGRQAFTLWVIAFGNLAADTETRLSNCATSGRYFKATNAAALQSTFKSIADQISMLRLTK